MGFDRNLGPSLTCPLFNCSDLLYDQNWSPSTLMEVAQNSFPSFPET
jgi:hypothetical protein